jgi:hypothetical protein
MARRALQVQVFLDLLYSDPNRAQQLFNICRTEQASCSIRADRFEPNGQRSAVRDKHEPNRPFRVRVCPRCSEKHNGTSYNFTVLQKLTPKSNLQSQRLLLYGILLDFTLMSSSSIPNMDRTGILLGSSLIRIESNKEIHVPNAGEYESNKGTVQFYLMHRRTQINRTGSRKCSILFVCLDSHLCHSML